jgi:arylsulfatase A-like enzyme
MMKRQDSWALKTEQPMNVVFILTDDQGTGDLGCLGNPIVQTPALDDLHDESIRFTNFHVGPTCAPTRSGLITGHYANSTGVWHTVGGRSLLRGNEVSMANVFAERGYRTGLFGKWHLGDNHPYRPQDRVFEEVLTHGGGGISQIPDHWHNDYFDDTYYRNGVPEAFKGYCTDVWFSEATDFIGRHRDEPFMCFITPNAPHSPYNVEKKYSDLYVDRVNDEDRQRFYGMITNIDENVASLMKQLKDWGLLESTAIVFMTDNGSSCGAKLNIEEFVVDGFNAGLRGMKNSAYDGGHRVPFFLRLPDGSNVDVRDIDTLCSFVDFMPTMMDLCGIPLRDYGHLNFHGQSLLPLIEGTDSWPDRVVTTDSQRVVKPVKWRQSAVMSQDWRLINGKELYDAHRDREQRFDVASEYPDVVDLLREEYEKWWALVSRQFDERVPISIGSDAEKTVRLTSHDWRPPNEWWDMSDCPNEDVSYLAYNQSQVRQGLGYYGIFEIDVLHSGWYDVSMRRWPLEEDLAICSGMEDREDGWRSDIIVKERELYQGGVPMDLVDAELMIGDQTWVKPFGKTAKSVDFTVWLEKGETRLISLFRKGDIKKGAYYTYVTCR